MYHTRDAPCFLGGYSYIRQNLLIETLVAQLYTPTACSRSLLILLRGTSQGAYPAILSKAGENSAAHRFDPDGWLNTGNEAPATLPPLRLQARGVRKFSAKAKQTNQFCTQRTVHQAEIMSVRPGFVLNQLLHAEQGGREFFGRLAAVLVSRPPVFASGRPPRRVFV